MRGELEQIEGVARGGPVKLSRVLIVACTVRLIEAARRGTLDDSRLVTTGLLHDKQLKPVLHTRIHVGGSSGSAVARRDQ